MSKNFLLKQISQFTIGLVVAGAGLSAGIGVASAQGVDPLDANQARDSDPFSNRDNGYSPFFNMMHRIQLGNVRSISEFSKDQQENLGTEADDFRTRQRELMQQNQQSPTPVEPSAVPTEPPVVNP
ncbi:hypothetical protein HJG54_18625 [Leptolyngbya sp. NK1-12]|uniref:Uncharacterized protein n=1 Tax=Leptolyngbya sp. NK1-12 TaxID=2547451 RepID=A0AA96WHD7_9CYAN|nr:hypothetical protein [Leptolyngbya sp. NK1-12]WNZ24665.1 hypothetical protein HJG54_18625 [Leptolyngbya sp. NK1-12]